MIYGFYLIIGFCLVLFQTAIRPHVGSLFPGFYDPLIVFVIYIAVFRPLPEGLPVVLFFGLIMDAFSGGPFGLYTSTYFWLVLSVRLIMKIFHMNNTMILFFIVAFGVLMENLICIGVMTIFYDRTDFPLQSLKLLAFQLLWAVGTGLILLSLLRFLHRLFDRWRESGSAAGNNQAG